MNAIHDAKGGAASIAWGEARWTLPPERTFGREHSIAFTFTSPIYQRPRERVFPVGATVARGTYPSP
jgi:hypothetical protein